MSFWENWFSKMKKNKEFNGANAPLKPEDVTDIDDFIRLNTQEKIQGNEKENSEQKNMDNTEQAAHSQFGGFGGGSFSGRGASGSWGAADEDDVPLTNNDADNNIDNIEADSNQDSGE
jgi:hypothetical protein